MNIGMRVRNSPRRTREERERVDHPRRGVTPDGGGGARESQRRSPPTRYDQRPAVSLRTTVNYMDAA